MSGEDDESGRNHRVREREGGSDGGMEGFRGKSAQIAAENDAN